MRIVMKRVCACLIAVSILFPLMPLLPLPTAAAASMNALDALGIDTTQEPAGYDKDAKNPYGRNTMVLNPVSELYQVGLSQNTRALPVERADRQTTVTQTIADQKLQSTLYGNNVWNKQTSKAVLEGAKTTQTLASGEMQVQGTYAVPAAESINQGFLQTLDGITKKLSEGPDVVLSTVAAGNFDGNREGKKEQAVLLYTSKLDKNGGIYFSVGDTTESNYGAPKTLVASSASIGNPAAELEGQLVENFTEKPFMLQNYLQTTTGDFDGDGRDEIAVYVPEVGNSRIEVYKLKAIEQADYTNPAHWDVVWTYALNEGTYVSNMVSLTAGDFNRDGIDDLAATWGYYYGPDDSAGSRAVVMFGANSKMLQASQEFPLTAGNANIVRGAFTYGDILGAGSKTLVLGGQSDTDLEAGKLYTRYVALYTWNGTKFEVSDSKNFDLFGKDKDNNALYPAMFDDGRSDIDTAPKFYSSPLSAANLAVAGRGPGKEAQLYFDSLLIQYTNNGLNIVGTHDNTTARQESTGSPQAYVEYGAAAGDLLGRGAETVATMYQTLPQIKDVTVTGSTSNWITQFYYANWWDKLWGIKSYRRVQVSVPANEQVPVFYTGKAYMATHVPKEAADLGSLTYESSKTECDVSTAICMANTDEDTTYVNYKNKSYMRYADPNVLAVLASPPYFSDLRDRNDFDSKYGESSTSYSSTKGSGNTETSSTTISAGAYVSVEQEFSVFGVKVAQAEAEVAVKSGFTWETEESSSIEQTVTYSASAGEDVVVLYSIPIQVFEYEASVPDGSGKYNTQAMTINIPFEAVVQPMPLDTYENIVKDYKGLLPEVSGDVLSHELGNPASYPKITDGYNKAIAYSSTPAGVTYGNGAMTQEIAMSKEKTEAFTTTVDIETKIGAGAGGVTVGVTFGAGVGGGKATTTTDGSSFSGTVYNMPLEASGKGYNHNWKIFSYQYQKGKLSFPVVSYLVNGVMAPPRLPDDFAQDTGKTGKSENALTWSYDQNTVISGFQLYRYESFPDGGKSEPLAFVPWTEGKADDGQRLFTYTDTGLNPNTEYRYQIEAVRTTAPESSIYSETLVARTKPARGYPTIALTGLIDGYLNIYPDTPSEVTVTATSAAPYNAPITNGFQWQKYTDGKWEKMPGKTAATLTFTNASAGDVGRYRCLINTAYYDTSAAQTYYISAYSDTFETRYDKRTVKIAENSFGATLADAKLQLAIALASVSSNTVPTGTVTFELSGTNYQKSVTVDLVRDGSTIKAKAEATVEGLSDGIYNVTATYSGDRVFKPQTGALEPVAIGKSGYQLSLSKENTKTTSFTYGDTIALALSQIEGGAVTSVSDGVTYQYQKAGSTGETAIAGVSLPTPGASDDAYLVNAYQNGTLVATAQFQVLPRPITVYQKVKSVPTGEVEDNKPENLLQSGSIMAFSESFDTFNSTHLDYIVTNSAGNEEANFGNATKPGNYTITPIVKTANPNYIVTCVPGTYTVTPRQYSVTTEAVKVGGMDAGTVTLTNGPSGSTYSAGTELRFTAQPLTGYVVDTWTVQRENETVITSQTGGNAFTYQMMDEAVKVIVTFKKFSPQLTVIAANGTVTSEPDFVKVGTQSVNNGASVTLTAVPDEGYHFVRWLKSEGGTATQAGREPTLVFTMPNMPQVTLTAEFARDSYMLTLGEHLEAAYQDQDGIDRIVGSGVQLVGDTAVTVRPQTGYIVPDDAVWAIDGATAEEIAAAEQSFTFKMTQDTSASVDTARAKYRVAAGAAEHGTVAIQVDGAPKDSPAEDIDGGASVTLTAAPQRGYRFKSWTINGTENASTSRVHVIAALGSDMEAAAVFEAVESHAAAVALNGNALGTNITYSIQGTLDEAVATDEPYTGGAITVYQGESLTVSIQPKTGFMIQKWTVNGAFDETSLKSKTFVVTSDLAISADIVPMTYRTVTYTAGAGGTLSAASDGISFESGDTYVGGGTTVVFTAAPDSGKMVAGWTRNGNPVLNGYGAPLVDETYTIDGLSEHAVVGVTFENEETFAVTQAGTNYTLVQTYAPAFGTDTLRKGAAASFAVTPDAGYVISGVTVNGNDFDTVTKSDDGTWICTVHNVQSDIALAIETQAYTKSSDATLQSLSVSGATLSPAFAAGTTAYTASVPHATDKVTISAAATDSKAHVTGTGEKTLAVGSNSLTVTVTAEDDTIQTYTITVTRAAAESGGSGSGGGAGGGGGGGGGETPPPATDDTNASVTINGQKVDATVTSDGTLVLTYKEEDIQKLADSSGNFDIAIAGQNQVEVNLDISALGEGSLSLTTDMGILSVPNDTLQALRTLYGSELRMRIVKGSFKISLLDKNGKEVTHSDAANPFRVTLPYALKTGENPYAVVAVRKDGGSVILPLAAYADGTATFAITATGTYDLMHNAKPFSDITSHWAEDYITFVTARELFAGTGDNTFSPNTSMTRAMFATVLWRLDGQPPTEGLYADFADIEQGAWYETAVGWAAKNGIVSGVGEGLFAPHTPLTREQMAVMLQQFITYKAYDLQAAEAAVSFADGAGISTWAKSAVTAIQRTGIITGKPNNLFDPQGLATRAEVTAVFYKLVERLQ